MTFNMTTTSSLHFQIYVSPLRIFDKSVQAMQFCQQKQFWILHRRRTKFILIHLYCRELRKNGSTQFELPKHRRDSQSEIYSQGSYL